MEKLFLILKNIFQKYKKTIKTLLNIILFAFSFGFLLYFCIQNDNWNKVIECVPKLNLIWVLVAVFAMMLSWYFDSLCILEIIRFTEKLNVKKSKIYKTTIIGQYFTSITPMGIGSPPAQTSELIKMRIKKNHASTVIGAKFIVYQISLSIYSLLCAIMYCTFFHLKSKIIFIYLLIGLACQTFTVCFVLIFLANKGIFTKIEETSKRIPLVAKYKRLFKKIKYSINFLAEALKSIAKNRPLMWKLFLYSFVQISLVFSVPFFIFKSFHHETYAAMEIIQTQCVANTACSFTPLPGNAGTSEKIFLDLFGSFLPENEIAVAMIIHRIVTFYLNILVGAIVYFFSARHAN